MQQELNYHIHRDLVAYPRRGRKAGLVAGQACLNDSLLYRSYGRIIDPPDAVAPRAVIEGATIFGGYLFPQFGHYLLESLARLSVCRLFPDTPIIWLIDKALKSWQAEILTLLGVKNPHIFINQATKLEEVILPQAGYVIRDFFSPEHAGFLGCYKAKAPKAHKKIWLSRSALPDDLGCYVNETELEKELLRHGWIIFHPQQHSVKDQLEMLADAERIAGTEGSALHVLILFDALKSKIDVFSRSHKLINQNYLTIAERKQFGQTVHYPEKTLLGDYLGVKSQYSLQAIAQVVQSLEG